VKSLVGGGLLVALAVFMLLGFLRSNAQLASFEGLMALGIAVVLPGLAGIGLIRRHLRSGSRIQDRRDVLRQQTLESEVLRLAGQRGGRLALVEVVTEMAVPTEAAQAALDALVHREIADIAVTDAGILIYTFRDIEKLGDKSKARGILE
jgi:hypothetical protein